MRNRKGKIVSVKASDAARRRSGPLMFRWGQAVLLARRRLGIEGWCPVGGASAKGKALHAYAKRVHLEAKATGQ